MKKYLAGFLLALVSTTMIGVAQAPVSVNLTVPFEFFVGSQAMPAGVYKVKANTNLSVLTVQGGSGKPSAMATVLTRLSPRSANESDAVFDVSGEKHYLAEIYVPGLDGFALRVTSEKHTHTSVKGK